MPRISKLHESIVSSSIWKESAETCKIWVTMLAIKDRAGKVSASVSGLAHQARVSVEACEGALAKFLDPDIESRSKNDQGRRIRVIDGGWLIINHRKYSTARDEDKRRDQNREAQQRRREKAGTTSATLSVIVDDPEGQWVRWSDVEKLREHLEGQIPEKRIERLGKALGLVHEGKCPECQRPVRGWQAPLGIFAPEAFATLREMGVDPTTGHKVGCSLSK